MKLLTAFMLLLIFTATAIACPAPAKGPCPRPVPIPAIAPAPIPPAIIERTIRITVPQPYPVTIAPYYSAYPVYMMGTPPAPVYYQEPYSYYQGCVGGLLRCPFRLIGGFEWLLFGN